MPRHWFCLALICIALPFGGARAADDLDLCNKSAGDPEAGIPACTRLLERERESANVPGFFNNRGVAKVRMGDHAGAIEDFTNALDRNPRYLDALRNRGLARQLMGDYDRAIADYNQALRIDSRLAALYNARGSTLLSKEEYDRAIADFDKAISLDRNYGKAFANRG